MSSVNIRITGSGQAYPGAPLNIAVPAKCLGFFIPAHSIAAACMDHSNYRRNAVPIGLVPDDVHDGYVVFKAGVKMLQTGIPASRIDVFAAAASDATLSGFANLPVITGTQSVVSGGDITGGGPMLGAPTNNAKPTTRFNYTTNGTTRSSSGPAITDSGYNWANWHLLQARWREFNAFIRDETGNTEVTSNAVAYSSYLPARDFRIGGQYDSQHGGTVKIAAIAFYEPTLLVYERAAIVAQIRGLAAQAGITV